MKKYNPLFIYFLLIALISSSISNAQSQSTPKVHLRSGVYDLSGPKLKSDQVKDDFYTSGDKLRYGYVQFATPLSAEQTEQLEVEGVQFIEYIPENTYYVATKTLKRKSSLKSMERNELAHLFQLPARFKIDPMLSSDNIPSYATPESGYILVTIIATPHASKDVIKYCKKNKIDLLETRAEENLFSVKIPKDLLELIAENSWVRFIELISPPKELKNKKGRVNHRVYPLRNDIYTAHPLLGEDIIVGQWDGGRIGAHEDLYGNVNDYSDGYVDFHSTHVAGTILGKGLIDPKMEGMAPAAKLWASDFQKHENDIIQEMTSAYGEGVRVTNNSWGYQIDPLFCEYNFPYLSSIQSFDKNAKDHPQLLHVFANGNDQDICPGGFFTGLWNMKNTLFVGAVNHEDKMSDFSSFGPTYDGRIIPHVSAVGVDVNSTFDGNKYYSLEGTSMAAPGVTGTVALLQEHYKNLNNNQYPTSALLKAIICNTARDKGNVGPDYKYGFGVIDALKAAESITNSYYFESEVQTNQEKSFDIIVPKNISQLKILLTYTDKEGSVMAYQALVNNLNLEVDFKEQKFYPWRLDPQNPNAPATKGVVSWDNIKQVTIDNPSFGVYSIKVKGAMVPTGSQPFAISYWLEENDINIVYPNKGVILNPGEVERLTWNAHEQNQDISVEISLDNGQNWQLLGTSNTSEGGMNFVVPQGTTSEAVIRIVNSEENTLSETFSIFKTPSNLKALAGYKEVVLSWDLVDDANSYDIFQIKEGELHFIDNTATNSFTIQNLEVNQPVLLTVRARADHLDMLSQRAVAITSTPIPMFDVGVVALYDPVSGCHLSTSEEVKVGVKNFGHHTFSVGEKIPVAYSVNFGGTYHDTLVVSQELPKNGVHPFTFKKKVYMSTPKSYTFQLWTTLEADSIITSNNMLTRTVENFNPITSFPYNQNFDAMPDLQEQIGDLDGVFNPVYLSGGWDNDHENDDFEWWPNSGQTLIDGTGPLGDHTSGEGKYLYTESAFLNGQIGEMYLLSPCFDLESLDQPTMYFWYHAFSESLNMGTLHLDVYCYDLQEWTEDIISPIQGSQKDQWQMQIVDLIPYRYMGSVKFRFRVVTSTSNQNAFAIDDFKISNRYHNDLAAINISPKAGERVLTDNETIRIDVVNYGKSTLPEATAIPIGFNINDTLTIREEFILPQPLNFADTITIPFNQTVNLSGFDKRFNVNTWVEMPQDAYRFNDSIVAHKIQTYTEVDSKCFAGVSPTGIGSFFLNGIHESQSIRNYGTLCGHRGTEGYSLNSSQRAVVYRGYEYDMGVQSILVPSDWAWPAFGQYFKVWIDFNRDGYLSDDETVFENDSRSLLFEEGKISIPENAELGITRLRVRSSYHPDEIMAPDAANGLIRFGETEDYVIEIRDYPTVDIEVISINTPTSQEGLGKHEKLSVNLKTRGSQPLAQGTILPFEVIINNTDSYETTAKVVQKQSLGDLFTLELLQDFDFSQFGSYRIALINKLATDLDPVNDTAFAVVTHMKRVNALGYHENFKNGPEGWWDGTELPYAIWELGLPDKPSINTPYSGDKVWVTKLHKQYPAETEAILYSPIFDFTTVTRPYLSLMLNIKTEEGYDGMVMEISTNGETWTKFSSGDDLYNYRTNHQDWDMGAPWWSGFSVGWKQFGTPLFNLVGENHVMFRFRFRSDLYVEDEGIALDNFAINEYLPNLEINRLVSPETTGDLLKKNETVKFTIKNSGNTIIPSQTQIAAGSVFNDKTSTESITTTKATRPGELYQIELSKKLDLSEPGIHCLTVFAEMDDDINSHDNSKEFCVESAGTGIETFTQEKLYVYPNPGSGIFFINLPNTYDTIISWEVMSIAGSLLNAGELDSTIDSSIDLSDLNPGIYLLKISTDGFSKMVKLVKN